MSLFRFTRTSQPQQPVPIDRNNPVTRGIVYCENLANTANAIVVGTKNVPSARGVAKGFGATLGAGSTDSVQTTLTTSSVARSFLIIYQRAGGGGGGGNGRVFDKRTVSGQVEEMQSGGTGMLYGGSWTNGSGLFSWGSFPSGTPINCVLSYDKSSTANIPTVYENGIKQAVSVAGAPTGSVITNTDPYVVGNRKNDSARNWDGLIYCFVVWDRALSESECKSLSDNPWQIFQPTNRAIYPETAAGGSTGNATGSLASITIDAATGTATGKATATATPASVSITAPTATATGGAVGNATGALSSVTLAGPSATASGKAQATTTPASVTLVSPSATATGKGQASGALAAVSLVAPMGTASASAGSTGNATASPASITIAAPSATATGAAAAFAAFMSVVLTPVSGTASSGVIQVAGAVTRDRRTQESSRPHSVSTSRPGRIATTTR